MSTPVPFNDARERLQAADLGVPVEWPNTQFKAPSPPGVWIAMDMESESMQPIELGGGVWEERGTLMLDIIIPDNWGTDFARVVAQNIILAFRGVSSGSLYYERAQIGNSGPDPERGKYYVMPVRIAWRYQDITVS